MSEFLDKIFSLSNYLLRQLSLSCFYHNVLADQVFSLLQAFAEFDIIWILPGVF